MLFLQDYEFIGGWDVFVHDPRESWSENEPLTNSHHEHFFVETGTKSQIKLGQTTYTTLNISSDPCGDESVTLCKENCRYTFVEKYGELQNDIYTVLADGNTSWKVSTSPVACLSPTPRSWAP